MRKATSLTISSDVLDEITATKGDQSTSERVNCLLRLALEFERRERLEQEAAEFFSSENEESARERMAYQKASRQVLARD